jgi:nitrate reductase assembly molybdenum cofactor insertion protein NarJ
MTYLDGLSIYQDFCVSLKFAKLSNQTGEEALKKTAAKYTFKQIADGFEALLNELDEKKEHYVSLFRLIAMVKKANGEKLEGLEK